MVPRPRQASTLLSWYHCRMENPTRTKVLYLITKSNFGGAQRYLFDLATHLPREQFEVVVALGGTGKRCAAAGSLARMLAEAGVRTVVVPSFMRDMSLLNDIRALGEVWRLIRTERPHVLHAMSSKAGGIGALVGRLAGVPTVVFTSHGLAYDESWRPRWQRLLILLSSWLTMLLAHRSVQLTKDTAVRAASLPFLTRRIVLIRNGIVAPDFLDRDTARTRLLPQAPVEVLRTPWIGTIAEYHPNKNLTALVEALALLRDRGTAAHLILISDGEEREKLAARSRELGVADLVHLVGYVPEGARYLKALDLFTLPSKKEGLPYVLLEAGYAELPVVVSSDTGMSEVVEDGVSGRTVTPTPENLAHAFASLLADPVRAQAYARKLHEHVREAYSLKGMVTDTTRLYIQNKPRTKRAGL